MCQFVAIVLGFSFFNFVSFLDVAFLVDILYISRSSAAGSALQTLALSSPPHISLWSCLPSNFSSMLISLMFRVILFVQNILIFAL